MRVVGAVRDVGEIGGRGFWIVQVPQRNPTGGEMLVDTPIVLPRRGGIAGHAKGEFPFVIIEQFAHQDAPH